MATQQDIFHILKDQHDEVRDLFRQITQADKPGRVPHLHREVEKKILVHSKAEEAAFYPALARHDAFEERVDQFEREHSEVEDLLEQLAHIDYDKHEWQLALAQVIEAFEHHAAEEEQQVFPKARQLMDEDELRELTRKYRHEFERREKVLIGPSSLESHSLDELRQHAREIGIRGAGDYSRSELISQIRHSV